MKKRRNIILWTVGILAVLFVGAYYIWDYSTNYVLRAIVSSGTGTAATTGNGGNPIGQQPTEPVSPPAAEQPAGGQDKPAQPDQETEQPAEQEKGSASGTGRQTETSTEGTGKGTTGKEAPPPATVPETNPSAPSTSPAPDNKPPANITTDQAQQAQESITVKDKAKVTSVLLKKLNSADINALMKLSEGGVSSEEKLEAKKLILQKLSEDEYNELISIAAKLGLSQSGMNYDDSAKQVEQTTK